MGWDFYTYEAQPPHFIEEILIFMRQEAEKSKEEMGQAGKGVNKGGGLKR